MRKLSPEGGGQEAMCRQGCWAPKEGELWVPHRLEKRTSAKDAGARRDEL